jgi:hypothetical protein
MNNSHKLAALLGGLTLVTVSALAQNTDPANNGVSMPSTTPAATPTTPVAPTPSVSTAPASKTNPSTDATQSARRITPSSDANGAVNDSDISRFKAMDTDNDGRVSRAEFTLSAESHLDAASTNGAVIADGKADQVGKAAADDKSATAATATTDTNLSISGNSFETFKRLDTDEDGYLSQAELAAAHRAGANAK